MLIPVKEAIEIPLRLAQPLGREQVALTDADGRVLAADVFSDLDMPPFDKSAMDGYALRTESTEQPPQILDVVGTIQAGAYPDMKIGSGQAAKIMTGAPVPDGADSVQMVEKTELLDGNKVRIDEAVHPGKHIARQGEVLRSGAKVLQSGTFISPAVTGLLATVGKAEVEVYRRPVVSILVTGDELVAVHEKPALGQIRNSNGYALCSQVRCVGAEPKMLGVATDTVTDLRDKIEQGLASDLLLISGGVSMGEFDFVEGVLEELGVKIFYEKVNLKPGKPTVFGNLQDTLVFGLPGNPVSTSTVFEIIVKPVLHKMMGFLTLGNPIVQAILAQDIVSKTTRESYLPASTSFDGEFFHVTPELSRGSADVLAFARSNSFLIVSSDEQKFRAGQPIKVMLRSEFWTGNSSII